jgi:hypothetical protein
MRIVFAVFGLLLSQNVLAVTAIATCANGIVVSAEINANVRDFRFWENLSMFGKLPHVRGTLIISNSSSASAGFSTEMVRISGTNIKSERAYLQSLGSNAMDFSEVPIAPQQKLQVEVYWPVSLELGTTVNDLQLKCIAS